MKDYIIVNWCCLCGRIFRILYNIYLNEDMNDKNQNTWGK